jgi:hypothetical protein
VPGKTPILFLDDVDTQRRINLVRRLQCPLRHPANPLIVPQHPWEANRVQCYGNVLHDGGRFRFWYFASEQRDPTDVPWPVPDRGRPARIYNACYAESEDGVCWHKPMRTDLDFPPYKAHNIVLPDIHSVCVHRDDSDPDPGRRYKMLGGAKTAVSADGLHWQSRPNEAVGKNDTGSSWLRWGDRYLAFVRQQTHEPDWPVVRAVGLSTSTDFDVWTPKQTVLTTVDHPEYPWVQPYGLSVFARGGLLIGILWTIELDRFEMGPDVSWKWNNSIGDIRMSWVCSRDGHNWSSVVGTQSVMTPEAGAWDSAGVWPATDVLLHDDRLWLYYSGTDRRHGEGGGQGVARSGIGLASLPMDRIVGLAPGDPSQPGQLDIPLGEQTGACGALQLNADLATPTDLRVEAIDEQGSVVTGYEGANSHLRRLDELRWHVTWGTDHRSLRQADSATTLRLELAGEALLFACEWI